MKEQEKMQLEILIFLSEQTQGRFYPINDVLKKWQGTKEDLIDILKSMHGKSISAGAYYQLSAKNASLDNVNIRAKLTSQWQQYYAELLSKEKNSLKIDNTQDDNNEYKADASQPAKNALKRGLPAGEIKKWAPERMIFGNVNIKAPKISSAVSIPIMVTILCVIFQNQLMALGTFLYNTSGCVLDIGKLLILSII